MRDNNFCLDNFSNNAIAQSGIGEDSLEDLTQVETGIDQGNTTPDSLALAQFSNTITAIDEAAFCEPLYEETRAEVETILASLKIRNLLEDSRFKKRGIEPSYFSHDLGTDPFEHLDLGKYEKFSEEEVDPPRPLLGSEGEWARFFDRQEPRDITSPKDSRADVNLKFLNKIDPTFEKFNNRGGRAVEKDGFREEAKVSGQGPQIIADSLIIGGPSGKLYVRPLFLEPTFGDQNWSDGNEIKRRLTDYMKGGGFIDTTAVEVDETSKDAKALGKNPIGRETGEWTQFDGKDGFYSNLNGLEKAYRPDGLSGKIFNPVEGVGKNKLPLETEALLKRLLSGKSDPKE